jgi:hypothetical protein
LGKVRGFVDLLADRFGTDHPSRHHGIHPRTVVALGG